MGAFASTGVQVMSLHKEFFGFLFLVFVGWIFFPSVPSERIHNACRPIGWAGNVVTSATSLILPKHQVKVQGWFDKFEYGCQYSVWRLIYQDAYNKEQAARSAAAPQKSASPASAPASSAYTRAPAPPAKP